MTSDESTLQALTAFLDDIEREYDFPPSPSPDPLERLRYIIECFAEDESKAEHKLKLTQRELSDLRRDHDELVLAVYKIASVVGAHWHEVREILPVRGKPKKARRKQ